MKKLIMLAIAGSLTLLAQNEKAYGGVEDEMNCAMGMLMMATVTFAPTGTTLLSGGDCRDEVLNLKEDAINYQLTGQMGALLAESIDAAQSQNTDLSEQEIVDRILAVEIAD